MSYCQCVALRSIAGIDFYVFFREVAGPHARRAVTVMQVHNDRNIFFQKAAMRGAFIERQRD